MPCQPISLLDACFTYLMTNSTDPDQLASSEANWSGSTLFAKTGHEVFCMRKVKWISFQKWLDVHERKKEMLNIPSPLLLLPHPPTPNPPLVKWRNIYHVNLIPLIRYVQIWRTMRKWVFGLVAINKHQDQQHTLMWTFAMNQYSLQYPITVLTESECSLIHMSRRHLFWLRSSNTVFCALGYPYFLLLYSS